MVREGGGYCWLVVKRRDGFYNWGWKEDDYTSRLRRQCW